MQEDLEQGLQEVASSLEIVEGQLITMETLADLQNQDAIAEVRVCKYILLSICNILMDLISNPHVHSVITVSKTRPFEINLKTQQEQSRRG